MDFATIVRLLWAGLALTMLAGVIWAMSRRHQDRVLERLRAEWGRLCYRDCDFPSLVDYHRAAAVEDGPAMDDRTWDDLNMDSVFTIIDRTESVIGQQALYHRMRTPRTGPTLDAFDALVKMMDIQVLERERAQVALAALKDRSGYDIWRLTRHRAIASKSWHAVFPALAVFTAVSMLATIIWPVALFFATAGAVTSLLLRASLASHLRFVVAPFRQIGPLLVAADVLASISYPSATPLVGTLRADAAKLARLRRISLWVSQRPGADLGSVLFEYFNALLCLDAAAVYLGEGELKSNGPTLLRVIAAVGEIDAAISVASFRHGTPGWTRPRWRKAGTGATMAGIRHPLIIDCVPNTVMIGDPSGVIVTGSNMSGKSTFLRTVGVTAVMAQSINMCLADSYEAPPFVVKSCIGRADDPSSGKSYYLVEVDSVLQLVKDSAKENPHLFLFDELFRGTNAVERIAAGEAVLRALLSPRSGGKPAPHVVLAATHDQELVELVVGWYVAYHFTDSVGDEGLAFDYQLLPGVATSRNAISLLKLRGAPEELVSRALNRAAALDRLREPTLLSMGGRTSA
jgi:hypothetical protein